MTIPTIENLYNGDIDAVLQNHPIFSKDERKKLEIASKVIKEIDKAIKLLEELPN